MQRLMQCILSNNQCRQSNTPHPLHTIISSRTVLSITQVLQHNASLIGMASPLTFYITCTLTRCTRRNSTVTLKSLLLWPNRSPHAPQTSLEEDIHTLNSFRAQFSINFKLSTKRNNDPTYGSQINFHDCCT